MSTEPYVALIATGLVSAAVCGQWLEDDCEPLATIEGEPSTLFGWEIAALGDADGDGVPDVVVAAPFHQTNRGRISAHSGADGHELWSHSSTTTSTILGFSLEVAGDLNNDGVNEVLAGAPFAPGTGGFVYLYSGADGTIMHTFLADSTQAIGYSISANGDFNGDGVEDIAIGDAGFDGREVNDGRVWVYSSDDYSTVCTIDPPFDPVSRFGTSSHFIGDVTGDGRDDLVVGEREFGEDPFGRLRIFSYADGEAQFEYTISPVNMNCSLCGDYTRGGKDVNGDDVPDIVVTELSPEWLVRVFSGTNGSNIHTLNDDLYTSADLVDDLDGDMQADIIVGASRNDEGGEDAGKAYVLSGADASVIRTMTSAAADTRIGSRVRATPDGNGDGLPDAIVAGGSGYAKTFILPTFPVDAIPGDIDGDGDVDFSDLLGLLGDWGECPPSKSCPADLDGSGDVGLTDLLTVLANWS